MSGRLSVNDLRAFKQRGEKLACLTAYDASFARVLDEAGVDLLLIGDSLGNVLHGAPTTLGVGIDDMVYHTAPVARAARRAFVVADMPFMSYATPAQACTSAARLLGEGQAQMVKVEGAGWVLEVVETLVSRGVPVCGHLGLTPQFVHQFGGYRVQGREPDAQAAMIDNARALVAAGAQAIVLEQIPAALAARITAAVPVPTIGIGAGAQCDGQVLVLHDVLGVSPRLPRLARDFLTGSTGGVAGAVQAYVAAVKSGQFPAPDHTFD